MSCVLASYGAAAAVLALLTVVPGPDVAVVTRFALTSGRRPATRAALGVVTGLIVWGVLTVLGLAAALAASAAAYTAVKLVGAAYLVALGLRAVWRSRRSAEPAGPARPEGPESQGLPLRTRLMTNLLNPKIAVFYTSLLPSLVPHGGSPRVWLPVLVLTHVALSLGWLTGCAVVLSRSRSVLDRREIRRLLDGVTGTFLIGFGVRIAAETR